MRVAIGRKGNLIWMDSLKVREYREAEKRSADSKKFEQLKSALKARIIQQK